MGIFKRKDYADIGKNGTTDELLKAFKEVKDWGYETRQKNEKLINGALQAFRAGRPENIQTAILNEKSYSSYYFNTIPSILFNVSEGSKDKLADIALALAKIPAQDKKAVLNNALNEAIANNIGGESFFSLLLQTGAKANGEIKGYAGAILVTATCNKSPISVIKLLHDNGASFDDALVTMHSRGHETVDIERLKFYQEKFAGKAAAAETAQPVMEEALIKVLETMQQMQEQISDLTKKVDGLKAAQPKKTKTPQSSEKKFYQSFNPQPPKKTIAPPTP